MSKLKSIAIGLSMVLVVSCSGAAAQDDQSQQQNQLPAKLRKSLIGHFVDKFYFWRLRYYFVAQNAANCDLFYGLIQDDPFVGRASVDFIFPNGRQCKGYALVTHYPHPRSVIGQSGFIKAKCSDGRVLKGNFTTTSLTTGHGTATDNLGNSYQFTFGQHAEDAVKEVNELRKKLGCEQCNPKDVELRVTGRILPPAGK